jgi:16S rRNA (adenine1518-N6/adenine1519-N6)-dimethyltransferase
MTTRAKKSLGQHWLIDRKVLGRMADAAEIAPGETVVEVGPGRGALTDLLAERASRLICVELDGELATALRERFARSPNVAVVEGDVLDLAVEDILNAGQGGVPYVVVGNLPYYIGTAITRKFLTSKLRPERLVVMLQAEVAERMAAQPGEMSYLAVEAQLYAEARLLFRIPAKAFRPPPKVQSAVVRLDVRDSPEVEVDSQAAFLQVVQAGFAAPRKRLRNSLAIGLQLNAAEAGELLAVANVDPDQRPAMLSLEQWRDVYFAWKRAEANSPERRQR